MAIDRVAYSEPPSYRLNFPRQEAMGYLSVSFIRGRNVSSSSRSSSGKNVVNFRQRNVRYYDSRRELKPLQGRQYPQSVLLTTWTHKSMKVYMMTTTIL